jgi:translation initiation factor 4G
MGRGDARNFSNPMAPPQQNSVGMDDLRRLGRSASRQASAQGPISFGPTSMFNTRGSNTSARKALGVLGRPGDESGASSRTATPPAQKKEKDGKESTNTFR